MISKETRDKSCDSNTKTWWLLCMWAGIFLVIVIQFSRTAAQAATPQQAVELTAQVASDDLPSPRNCIPIKAAMAMSAERSPNVFASSAIVDRARSDATIARSLARPQISVFGRTQTGDGGLTGNAVENQIGLRASQRIFDFGVKENEMDVMGWGRFRKVFGNGVRTPSPEDRRGVLPDGPPNRNILPLCFGGDGTVEHNQGPRVIFSKFTHSK